MIDNGAESNTIRAFLAEFIGTYDHQEPPVDLPNRLMTSIAFRPNWETSTSDLLWRNAYTRCPRLVVEDLNVDKLVVTPFMITSDIAFHPEEHKIIIAGSDTFSYGSLKPHRPIELSGLDMSFTPLVWTPTFGLEKWLNVQATPSLVKDTSQAIEPWFELNFL